MTEKRRVPETLADACMAEMTRIRDDVMPAYQEIGPAGGFALMMMRNCLDKATRALAEGDAVTLLRLLPELKEFHT